MAVRKPSIKIRKNKYGLEIVKTFYNEFGKAIEKQIEAVYKK